MPHGVWKSQLHFPPPRMVKSGGLSLKVEGSLEPARGQIIRKIENG